ncbi:MAG: TetR/AcrR family transcriptional regulator [Burkholderiaceae bacterium]
MSFDREVALERAMLTFWRYGYETTSINDLTAAMGITAPSIYTAFGDKKQLFLEAMHLYAGSSKDLRRLLEGAETARDAAHAMLIGAAESFTGKNTPPGCLLASATASGSAASADVQAAVTAVRSGILNQLRMRILRDVQAGVLPGDTDASALAAFVIALIQGMSVLARDGMKRNALKAMIDVSMTGWPNANLRLD